MKKYLLFVTIFLTAASIAFAQTNANITLKDGTILKGRVIKMEKGVYTIQTPYLNKLQINESNIESITEHIQQPVSKQRLKSEVDQIQGQVLANPALMEEIQKAMQDPEVQQIMQNKDFINAIMSMDPQRIKNNPATSEMLQNPKIRALFQKIESTLDNHSNL